MIKRLKCTDSRITITKTTRALATDTYLPIIPLNDNDIPIISLNINDEDGKFPIIFKMHGVSVEWIFMSGQTQLEVYRALTRMMNIEMNDPLIGKIFGGIKSSRSEVVQSTGYFI